MITLRDIIRLIDEDAGPAYDPGKKYDEFDDRPQSVFNVQLRFMSEKETWITVSIYSTLLIPWYDCGVSAIEPEEGNVLGVWLKHEDYLHEHFQDALNELEIYQGRTRYGTNEFD